MTQTSSSTSGPGAPGPGVAVQTGAGPDPDAASDGDILGEAVATAARIHSAVCGVLSGKSHVVHLALTVLLADGHLLIEDVPGVGKTALAKALAATIGGRPSRIQFTADLLPSDVTGVAVYNPSNLAFQFRPGPIFANIVLADEINRASPKTQAALLECMAERQVTVDGVSHHLERPFLVIATANPIEMAGTYALPEAQRDRFMARIPMGYPDYAAEVAMLVGHTGRDPVADLTPQATPPQVAGLFAAVDRIYVSDAIRELAVTISHLTRNNRDIRLGASPRATLHLVRAARAAALLAGRDYVIRDDLLALAPVVLGHRLVLVKSLAGSGVGGDEVVSSLLAQLPRLRG